MSTIKPSEPASHIDTSLYDDYVGRYDYIQVIFTVTREGDRLFVQGPGQSKYQISPRSDTEFYWKAQDAQIKFVRNEENQVTHLIHRQGGQELKAMKLAEETLVEVDPSIYDAYLGEYDLSLIHI